jgi:hypothetical protein
VIVSSPGETRNEIDVQNRCSLATAMSGKLTGPMWTLVVLLVLSSAAMRRESTSAYNDSNGSHPVSGIANAHVLRSGIFAAVLGDPAGPAPASGAERAPGMRWTRSRRRRRATGRCRSSLIAASPTSSRSPCATPVSE